MLFIFCFVIFVDMYVCVSEHIEYHLLLGPGRHAVRRNILGSNDCRCAGLSIVVYSLCRLLLEHAWDLMMLLGFFLRKISYLSFLLFFV